MCLFLFKVEKNRVGRTRHRKVDMGKEESTQTSVIRTPSVMNFDFQTLLGTCKSLRGL